MSLQKTVRSNLERRTLAQFDSLVTKDEIFWEPTQEIRVEQKPFDVYFRISPALQPKPYNPDTKSRRPGFLDDDPEFTVVPHVSPNHKLILNKYCWLRPQLILHTLDFQRQTELLTEDDFVAGWDVLNDLGARYMVIFNGGPDAGSSVAHKHLQVFERPEWRTAADEFCEALETGEVDEQDATSTTNSNPKPQAAKLRPTPIPLPFTNLIAPLKATTSPAELYDLYLSMCDQLSITSSPSTASQPQAHSLIFTQSWIMLIPRTSATIHGPVPDAPMQGGANAMIGMLWLKSNEQMTNWVTFGRGGPMGVLREFGVDSSGTGTDVSEGKEE